MSLLTEVFRTLDTHSLGEMASALGESDKTVSGGVRSAIAALLGGMATKSSNPSLLRQTLQLAPPATEGTSWSDAAGAIADPGSPALALGRRVLSTLFGDSAGVVTHALGTGTGLQSGKMSALLAMAAPIVMSFLGKRVRDEGMSMTGLGNLLQHEVPAIRSELPQGVTDLFWPKERSAIAASPVVAQAATVGGASRSWLLPALLLFALIPTLFWVVRLGRRPSIETPLAAVGTANRAVSDTDIAVPKLSPVKSVDLYFGTGSKALLPESDAKLKQFADALTADPSARVTVTGYTDNVGNAAANIRLSQNRANAVEADLVRMGFPADRISAQGLGEENPLADNATAEGRATNRRVSVALAER